MIEINATAMAKNFGEWHDRALSEPVMVMNHRRPSVVVVNARTFQRFVDNYREVVDVADLDDLVASSIERNDIPEEHRWESTAADVDDLRRGV